MKNAYLPASFACWLIGSMLLAPSRAEDAQPGVAGVGAWRSGVEVRPVLGNAECHSIHAYFNTSPESPDGRYVLFYRSTTPDAHQGEICIVRRDTGELEVLATGIAVEDGHRVACQQWSCGGREVVFHDLRDGRWVVAAIEIASGRERVLAEGRQLAWGQPAAEIVTLYGPHWNPGEHRNLELLNVRTGKIETVLTIDAVKTAHAEWIQQQFGDRPLSIFFPILSPNQQRVFFKLAAPEGGDFRSSSASRREGLFCYDLAERKFLPMYPSWGHPAWHPDSRQMVNVRSKRLVTIDTTTGAIEPNAKLPQVPGSHPSFSFDGRLVVTDFTLDATVDEESPWGVLVADLTSGESALIHRFDNSRGAATWRRSHPHPIFSSDGRRIYFNVSADRWTRLYLAER